MRVKFIMFVETKVIYFSKILNPCPINVTEGSIFLRCKVL